MLKIVQVVRSLELGGLERLTVDLAIAQRSAGHSVILYSIYKHESAHTLLEEARRSGVSVIHFNKAKGFSIKTLWAIARQLRRDRPSVVHTHNELVHPYAIVASKFAGVPCLVNTIHGTKAGKDPGLDRRYRWLLPWTDLVIGVSDQTLLQFAADNARRPAKFHVIHNGLPVEKFVAQSAQPGSEWPCIRIGTVGRLVGVKDQANLVHAFQRVHTCYPSAELHILGDGPLMGQLKLLSGQLGIGCKVIFHGANSNVAGFLSRLDLFVLSSLSEGLPIAVLEAMSAGLPIVSTRVGGIPEVALEHSVAVYCPPGEPEAMADAIVGVLDPARMRTMGQTGQSIAQKSFTIEAMCLRYEALYRAVLSSKSSIT